MTTQIPVRIEFNEVDPEGEICPFCGDTIYLNAFLMSIYSRQTGVLVQQIPKQICGSCCEILQQEYC